MEIYKDEVYDLLVDRETVSPLPLLTAFRGTRVFPQAVKLPVRENEAGQVFVANLSTLPVDTLEDFDRVFTSVLIPLFCSLSPTGMLCRRANKQRSVSSTNLNSVSSRSHAILTLHVSVVDPAHNLSE